MKGGGNQELMGGLLPVAAKGVWRQCWVISKTHRETLRESDQNSRLNLEEKISKKRFHTLCSSNGAKRWKCRRYINISVPTMQAVNAISMMSERF